jgi:hypothetical protein
MEEVSFKLGLPEATLLQYLQEWGQERKDKAIVKRELLRACLKRHIGELKNRQTWARLLPDAPEGRMEELENQVSDCQRLLAVPSRISKQDREFLLAEYSAAVLSEMNQTPAAYCHASSAAAVTRNN